jgi:hypothetical protein
MKPPLQIMKGGLQVTFAEIPRGWRRRPGKEKCNMHGMRGDGKEKHEYAEERK